MSETEPGITRPESVPLGGSRRLMARQDPDWGLSIPVGGIGAIALGVALIPLRTVTSASNLAFVFLILTVVVAEVGGRSAGLATAVMSALSLNFFLTEPYLTLTIDKPDDIVAFVALAVSGLVAAAFGRRRARSSALVSGVRRDLEALERVSGDLAAGASLDTVLEDLRRPFGLGGLVLRGPDGDLLAAAPPRYATLSPPDTTLQRPTLLAPGERRHRFGRRGFRLPEGGGRLRLDPDGGPLWLDVWEGDAEGLGLDDCQALAVAITMLELSLRISPTPSDRLLRGAAKADETGGPTGRAGASDLAADGLRGEGNL